MIFECLQAAPAPTDSRADALVCVMDHDEVSRRDLERLFLTAGFHVETFASTAGFLDRGTHPGPVCIVLDIGMPGLDGIEFQKLFDSRDEQLVFHSSKSDFPMCVKAIKAGASDFLIKPVDGQTLIIAVERALEIARTNRRLHAERQSALAKLASLTDRETEVMQCVISGMLNKQIAAKLGISEKTVKIHRGRVMKKTCCSSVPDLLKMAMKADLIPCPVDRTTT